VRKQRVEEGGAVVYKVAYVGLGPTGDEWINADAVPQQHLERFLQRWAERRAERVRAEKFIW
jgi:hypothetical protein